ncbi:hypothetical protein LY76DRAFT_597445 [Colletotrichum caudatum]|nr:hypothetical protein LY76DRAFT_597445 [Colletotrichum caudatum]
MSSEDEIPVRCSIRQLDAESWVIGGCILLSRTTSSNPSGTTWSDGKGAYFTVSYSQEAPPPGALPPTDGPIKLVHDVGDASAVWSIGDAFLKVHKLDSTDISITREHTTLEYLHGPSRPKLTFPTPRYLFHAEFGGRYYLVTSRIPGQTLEAVWPTMEELDKQICVDRIVDICKELVLYGGKSTAICGVDGKHIYENWLSRPGQADKGPRAQLDSCTELGMDCSDLVLSHNDMGPQNVIVDLARTRTDKESSIGIIDWEMAGFVPRAWIRTKFRICGAMDLDFPGHTDEDGMSERVEWRRRVQRKLEEEGFPEVSSAYMDRLHMLPT